MSTASTLSTLLNGLVGDPYICPASRKLTGRNLGRLLRDYKSLAALNAVLENANGACANIASTSSIDVSRIAGSRGIEAIGHCGQYLDFGLDDSYMEISLTDVQGGAQDIFDNQPALSIGLNIFYVGGRQAILAIGNSDFYLETTAGKNLELTLPLNQYGAAIDPITFTLGQVPLNQWSTHLIVFDGPNRKLTHFTNGALNTNDWNQDLETGTETINMISTQYDLRFGVSASDGYNFGGYVAGFFMTPRVVSVTEADEFFYNQDYMPEDYGTAVYVPINNSAPTAGGAGVWTFDTLGGTFTATITSADTSGDIYAGGRESTTSPQKMIDSEGYLSFADKYGYCQLSSTPAVGSGVNFTISTWVKPCGTLAAYNHVFLVDGGPLANDTMLFSISGADNSTYFTGNVGGNAVSVSSAASGITVDSWNHVAVAIDLAVSGIVYINGEVASSFDSTPWADYNFAGFSQWTIGAPITNGAYVNTNKFAGFIISTSALDSASVIDLANLTKPSGEVGL